jgi:tetratricopeptide (TPR) repeat protein
MASTQNPQVSIRAEFYRQQARQLLSLGSIEEVERFLSTADQLDWPLLLQTLKVYRDDAAATGRTASAQLADFVLEVVQAFHHERNRALESTSVIETAEGLLQAAVAAPSGLQAARLLQRHSDLLSAQILEGYQLLVLDQLRNSHGNPPPNAVRLLLCLVLIAKLLGEPRNYAKWNMIWASFARDHGRPRAALRRFARAASTAEVCGDAFLRIGVLVGRAAIYDSLGDTRRAADDYSDALALAKSAPGQESVISATSMKLAACLRGLSRYADALQLIDSGLAANDSLSYAPEIQGNYELRSRLYRGLLLEDLGRFDEGRAEYQKAAKLALDSGDRGREFTALTNLAASYAKIGEYRKSVQNFQQLLRTTERWGALPMVASTHNNLGNMLLNIDRASEALSHFFAALSTKMSTESKAGEVISYIGIIHAYGKLGQFEEAKAFETLCAIPVLESGDVASIMIYASHMMGEGADPADAEFALSLVQSVRERALERGDVVEYLRMSLTVGRWNSWHGTHEEALEGFRQAIKVGLAEDPHAHEILDLQIALGEELSKVPETCQEAYDVLAPLVARIDAQISEAVLDQRLGNVIGRWIRLFGALIRLLTRPDCALRLEDNSRSPSDLAFNLHESAKARSFAGSLATMDLPVPDTVPIQLRSEEIALLKRKREYQAESSWERAENESLRLNRLREIAADLNTCWQKMEPHAPAYVKLRRAESARIEDARAILRDNTAGSPTALVSAFVDEKGLIWFVQRSDSQEVQVFHAPLGSSALLAAAKGLRRIFNGAPSEFPPYPPIRRTEPGNRGLDFFEKLSGDILSFLPGIKGVEHICIAPHGALHLLPLHALRTEEGHYLAEEFAVTYAPSLSSLRYCIARRTRSDAHVSGGSVYCAGVASREDVRPDLFEHDDTIFAESGFADIVVESGLNATPDAVLRGISRPAVVHLTCHGFFDETNPLKSGLLLSNGSERSPRNALQIPLFKRSSFILTAGDFLRTTMNAELVTLRACSTGLQAARNAGDEFDGFSRNLIQAGNAATLVSLWNVDQESSHRFLKRFYQNWSNPVRPIEKWRALWMTQKEFLCDTAEPFLRHPYHWAPLVLIGDWR